MACLACARTWGPNTGKERKREGEREGGREGGREGEKKGGREGAGGDPRPCPPLPLPPDCSACTLTTFGVCLRLCHFWRSGGSRIYRRHMLYTRVSLLRCPCYHCVCSRLPQWFRGTIHGLSLEMLSPSWPRHRCVHPSDFLSLELSLEWGSTRTSSSLRGSRGQGCGRPSLSSASQRPASQCFLPSLSINEPPPTLSINSFF